MAIFFAHQDIANVLLEKTLKWTLGENFALANFRWTAFIFCLKLLYCPDYSFFSKISMLLQQFSKIKSVFYDFVIFLI